MSEVFEFTDRYAGIMPYPDPATMCAGRCEGMGCHPCYQDNEDPENRQRWLAAHEREHHYLFHIKNLLCHPEWWLWKSTVRDFFRGELLSCHGCHFIVCADCEGTGLRK